jgi:hypothetical protein
MTWGLVALGSLVLLFLAILIGIALWASKEE